MAATNYYCTDQDIIDRARLAGVLARCDDDASGSLSATERLHVTDSKLYACATIDGYLANLFTLPISQTEAAENQWLKDRAIALALEHLAGRGGGGIPQVVIDAAERARLDLVAVAAKRQRVPGLTYPVDSADETLRRGMGRPVACNPGYLMGREVRPWRRY